jgi:hypothetical protein
MRAVPCRAVPCCGGVNGGGGKINTPDGGGGDNVMYLHTLMVVVIM